MTAAEKYPEPSHQSAAGPDGDELEQAPTWAGDMVAAQRFSSPEEIRAALLPAQREAFNAALTMARQTLRLDQLRHVLRMWRRQALMTEWDPEGHRQMLATAAEVQWKPAHRDMPSRPASAVPPSGTTSWLASSA